MDYAAIYGKMHENAKHYPGYSLTRFMDLLAPHMLSHNPDRILDYGSGKGYQYLARRLHERWGGPVPHCYDPGVRQLQEKPEGPFGAVINTDVLEHIEKEDLPGVIREMIDYVAPGGLLFLGIACRPAKNKTLPDGRNVHVTVAHPDWWIQLVMAQIKEKAREDIEILMAFDNGDTYPDAPTSWSNRDAD